MSSASRFRTIGVLGGMGPAATVDFLAKIVAATAAERDQDHVPVLVHNIPQIPDRSQAIAAGSDAPFAPMLAGLQVLEAAGAEVLAIPCNTAHHWHSRLAERCRRPLLHIAEAAIVEVVRGGHDVVGLMATRGTVASGFYQDRLSRVGRTVVIPNETDQAKVDAVIRSVKSGQIDGAAALAVGETLLRAGADVIIMACTELPLAVTGAEFSWIDPADALARACVAASFSTNLAEAVLGW